MNLVQKLPIGLSLACLMFMSSCSKEDAQTPEPKVEGVNAHSGLRGQGGIVVGSLAIFPPTIATPGLNVYPEGWKRAVYPGTPTVADLPTGVSDRTHAFGNYYAIANKWVKQLPAIPSAPDAKSFVTITTKSSTWDVSRRADAQTTIKNLLVGNTYSVDFYVATTSVGGPNAGYAKKVIASVGYPSYFAEVDLTGKKAEWVKANFAFKATHSEAIFIFAATSENNNTSAYAHIFVDQNSIKKVL